MVAQTPYLLPAKNHYNWLITVKDIASHSSVVSRYNMTEETQFLEFMFPHIVERH